MDTGCCEPYMRRSEYCCNVSKALRQTQCIASPPNTRDMDPSPHMLSFGSSTKGQLHRCMDLCICMPQLTKCLTPASNTSPKDDHTQRNYWTPCHMAQRQNNTSSVQSTMVHTRMQHAHLYSNSSLVLELKSVASQVPLYCLVKPMTYSRMEDQRVAHARSHSSADLADWRLRLL